MIALPLMVTLLLPPAGATSQMMPATTDKALAAKALASRALLTRPVRDSVAGYMFRWYRLR